MMAGVGAIKAINGSLFITNITKLRPSFKTLNADMKNRQLRIYSCHVKHNSITVRINYDSKVLDSKAFCTLCMRLVWRHFLRYIANFVWTKVFRRQKLERLVTGDWGARKIGRWWWISTTGIAECQICIINTRLLYVLQMCSFNLW